MGVMHVHVPAVRRMTTRVMRPVMECASVVEPVVEVRPVPVVREEPVPPCVVRPVEEMPPVERPRAVERVRMEPTDVPPVAERASGAPWTVGLRCLGRLGRALGLRREPALAVLGSVKLL